MNELVAEGDLDKCQELADKYRDVSTIDFDTRIAEAQEEQERKAAEEAVLSMIYEYMSSKDYVSLARMKMDGDADDIFYDPRHPYTWALLSSMPDLNTKEKLEAIPGTPPNMIYPPKGDAFAERNKYALEIDFEEQPPLFEISETHYAATWLLHPNAPKVNPPKIITERIARMKEAQLHE